ncbi:hypothetical protein [Nocardia farcinica]|uniref:hypothetical protein n=1 Tax=Nocardia farcinica TaxID=37329 RepID=UPI001894758E|nr:hypothetical protein [Nocardia farcinica]MBF6187597.1 hypothetical protein [Nocardia farcinica]
MTETWLLRRFAYADQLPKGADIQQAARDSVIRCAAYFGFRFTWDHDMHGEKWRYRNGVAWPTGIPGVRATAICSGPIPAELRLSGAAVPLPSPLRADSAPRSGAACPDPLDGDAGGSGHASNLPCP